MSECKAVCIQHAEQLRLSQNLQPHCREAVVWVGLGKIDRHQASSNKGFYNARRHSGLGYKRPNEVRYGHTQPAAAASKIHRIRCPKSPQQPILLLGVFLGGFTMALGMLVHEASVLIVILNAMRLLRHMQGTVAPPTPCSSNPLPPPRENHPFVTHLDLLKSGIRASGMPHITPPRALVRVS